jgi:hypothetical protein
MAVGSETCSGMNLESKELSAELLCQWISPEVIVFKSAVCLIK